jgi:3-dehydroquinate dehydratase/shikimate dehydrogenase
MEINTKRLNLRPWQESDFEPFAKLNADPRVMEFFPSVLTRGESDRLATRIKTRLEEKGWGLWAAALLDSGEFIGFIGLNEVTQESLPAPFTPAVEIGWRLSFDFWGKGYATEGALAALQYGFDVLHLKEIVSFTAVPNLRSRHVMEKIGMHRDPKDDFDHPKIPDGHFLKRHVLYRI